MVIKHKTSFGSKVQILSLTNASDPVVLGINLFLPVFVALSFWNPAQWGQMIHVGDLDYPLSVQDAINRALNSISGFDTATTLTGQYQFESGSWFIQLGRAVLYSAVRVPWSVIRIEYTVLIFLAFVSMKSYAKKLGLDERGASLAALVFAVGPVFIEWVMFGWIYVLWTLAIIPSALSRMMSIATSSFKQLTVTGALFGIVLTLSQLTPVVLIFAAISLSCRQGRYKFRKTDLGVRMLCVAGGAVASIGFWVIPRLIYNPVSPSSFNNSEVVLGMYQGVSVLTPLNFVGLGFNQSWAKFVGAEIVSLFFLLVLVSLGVTFAISNRNRLRKTIALQTLCLVTLAAIPQSFVSDVMSNLKIGVDPARGYSIAILPISLALGNSFKFLWEKGKTYFHLGFLFGIFLILCMPHLRGGLFSRFERVDPGIRLVGNREVVQEIVSTNKQLEKIGPRGLLYVLPQTNAVKPKYQTTYARESAVLNAANTYFAIPHAGQITGNNYKTSSARMPGSDSNSPVNVDTPLLEKSPLLFFRKLKEAGVTHILVNQGTVSTDEFELLLRAVDSNSLKAPEWLTAPSMGVVFELLDRSELIAACGQTPLSDGYATGRIKVIKPKEVIHASILVDQPDYWTWSSRTVELNANFDKSCIGISTLNRKKELHRKSVLGVSDLSVTSTSSGLVNFSSKNNQNNLQITGVFRPAQLQLRLFLITLASLALFLLWSAGKRLLGSRRLRESK